MRPVACQRPAQEYADMVVIRRETIAGSLSGPASSLRRFDTVLLEMPLSPMACPPRLAGGSRRRRARYAGADCRRGPKAWKAVAPTSRQGNRLEVRPVRPTGSGSRRRANVRQASGLRPSDRRDLGRAAVLQGLASSEYPPPKPPDRPALGSGGPTPADWAAERRKGPSLAAFCTARSSLIPPRPWPGFSSPFSAKPVVA